MATCIAQSTCWQISSDWSAVSCPLQSYIIKKRNVVFPTGVKFAVPSERSFYITA